MVHLPKFSQLYQHVKATDQKLFVTLDSISNNFDQISQAINSTSTNTSTGNITTVVYNLTAAFTAPVAPVSAGSNWILILIQDTTGGRITTFPSSSYTGASAFIGMLNLMANTYSSLLFYVRVSDGKSMLIGYPATGLSII